MCLVFKKILDKVVVKYVPTYTKGYSLKKKKIKEVLVKCYVMFLRCSVFLIIKAYVVGN